jgi:hypothetical protein
MGGDRKVNGKPSERLLRALGVWREVTALPKKTKRRPSLVCKHCGEEAENTVQALEHRCDAYLSSSPYLRPGEDCLAAMERLARWVRGEEP